MALSCNELTKLENEKTGASSDMEGPPVAFILFVVIVLVVVLLWTFFPSLFLMVLVFLVILVVVYNTRAGKEALIILCAQ
jgi:asparagine N-glycosylation enzyme membrane subunit Stt3